jgi:hypothetical protein
MRCQEIGGQCRNRHAMRLATRPETLAARISFARMRSGMNVMRLQKPVAAGRSTADLFRRIRPESAVLGGCAVSASAHGLPSLLPVGASGTNRPGNYSMLHSIQREQRCKLRTPMCRPANPSREWHRPRFVRMPRPSRRWRRRHRFSPVWPICPTSPYSATTDRRGGGGRALRSPPPQNCSYGHK